MLTDDYERFLWLDDAGYDTVNDIVRDIPNIRKTIEKHGVDAIDEHHNTILETLLDLGCNRLIMEDLIDVIFEYHPKMQTAGNPPCLHYYIIRDCYVLKKFLEQDICDFDRYTCYNNSLKGMIQLQNQHESGWWKTQINILLNEVKRHIPFFELMKHRLNN